MDTNSLFEQAQELYFEDRYEEAYPIFKQAYDAGDLRACGPLGDIYLEGAAPGQEESDPDTAIRFYEEGMSEGYVWCTLQWCGYHADMGIEDPRVIPMLEALVYDEEDPESFAAYVLSEYYMNVLEDEEKAEEWLEKCREMGCEIPTDE